MDDGVRCMKVRAYDEARGLDKTATHQPGRTASRFYQGYGNLWKRLRQVF
jgi:hypothetical protein